MHHASAEYPYDAAERFSVDELRDAANFRQAQPNQRRGETATFDRCPHTPACPTLAVCVEEIAWYLRHRHEIDGLRES